MFLILGQGPRLSLTEVTWTQYTQMGVINPRKCIITFRLSAPEYECVSQAAGNSSARSLSDFARCAVLERAQKSRSSDFEDEQLRILKELSQIMIEVKQRVGEVLVGLPVAKVS